MSEKRIYSPDFFHCQGTFAFKLYRVLIDSGIDITLENVLKHNTALYREVTHKGKSKNGLEVWQNVAEESQNNLDSFLDYLVTRLYFVYAEQAEVDDLTQSGETCLKTEWVSEVNGIQMHYVPSILNGKSTLSAINRPYRFNEYLEKFKQLIQLYPEKTKMFGFSWLYNLQIYTWIFPAFTEYFDNNGKQLKHFETKDFSIGERMYPTYDPRYVHDKIPMPLNSWAIWGQFLQKGYESNSEQIKKFEKTVDNAATIEEVIDAFPYPLRYYENTLGIWWQHLTKMKG